MTETAGPGRRGGPLIAASATRGSRPLGAIVSQGIVAASSLVLQFIALNRLGAAGLGSFSLLLGILITVNSIQSGWIGDSLTVLDRFEPGMRRALVQSQSIVIVVVGVVTTTLALPVGGVDRTSAVLFGLASVAWVIEETLRRLLIARREFWKLVANDASFAVGSLGLIGYTALRGETLTLETLVVSLLAGAVVAIGVGVTQLPRIELSRGLLAPSRLRVLSSFAFWRAAQVGLRPGSQALVRAAVAATVSLEALGRLETARLLLAPILTAVNGIGVYLLPTYSAQARRLQPFSPSVRRAMTAVGAIAAGYGVVALAARGPLLALLDDGSAAVSIAAIVAWSVYSIGFGAGVPAGNAMVASGRSRTAFGIRCLDAAIGVGLAASFAVFGWVDIVPLGLAAGTFVGATLLVRSLADPRRLAPPDPATERTDLDRPGRAFEDPPLIWRPPGNAERPAGGAPTVAQTRQFLPAPRSDTARDIALVARRRETLQQRMLWLVPIVLIVATEYKVRRRGIDDALTGAVDPTIALELLVYGVIGVWAVWRLAPTRPALTPITMLMWGYVLTTAASALYSTFPMLGLARAVQLVILGAVFHVISTEATVTTMSRMLHAWVVLISVSILVGLAYVAPTSNTQAGRFTWLHVHSVSAGSMLALSVCVVFGLWLSAGRTPLPWPRMLYGTLFVIQFAFLMMTRTRGSIGAAIVALAAMAWVWSGNRMKPQLLLASFVAGGAAMLAFGAMIIDFLTRADSTESFGTFNRRTEIWSLAWESFLGHPLHGLGFTSADGVFFDETGLGGAHNAVINVMVDVGLIGLVWWLGLIVATIAVLTRQWNRRRFEADQRGATGSRRADHLVMMGVVVVSLLNSVTTEGLGAGVNVSAIWLFLVVAWLCVLDRDARPSTGV